MIAHAMVIALYQSKSRWLGVKISTGRGGKRCDISEHITELIKQLLKLYEGLTERYRERVNWLEEDRDDNSFRCQPEPVDEGNARSRGRPR